MKYIYTPTPSGIRTIPDHGGSFAHQLPVGTYTLAYDDARREMYFKYSDDLLLPSKVYGSQNLRVERIIRSYTDRTASTGVMLVGEKGSGKTLLAKMISSRLAKERQMPTILVNEAFEESQLVEAFQMINTEAVIIFDEFEKTYARDSEQNGLLNILDGTHAAKRLVLMTANKSYNISEYFVNRPGRFLYWFEYKGLTREEILEICGDCLNDMSQTESILQISSAFVNFNFDMLMAIIQESNRFKMPVMDLIDGMNILPLRGATTRYSLVEFYIDGVLMENTPECDTGDHNPIHQQVYVEWDTEITNKDGTKVDDSDGCYFNSKHITKYDGTQKILEYTKTIVNEEDNKTQTIRAVFGPAKEPNVFRGIYA